jgi:hypothetical protein
MNGRDSGVPHKIPRIEGEQPSDLMDVHGSDQAGIVHLDARNGVGNQQIPPLPMHGPAVFQKSKPIFYKPCPAVHFENRKTVAIPLSRAGTGIPELSQILRRVTKVVSSHPEPVYG